MNATVKNNLIFPTLPASAPGADWSQLQHVRTLMGLSPRRLGRGEILRLIDRREIGWAWDISRKGSRRPEIRIWRESLLAWLSRAGGRIPPPPAGPLTLGQVVAAVLPKTDPLAPRTVVIRGTELQRRLLCSRAHLAGLMADGELQVVGAAGCRESPAFLYQSVFEFLRRRTMSV